MAHFGSLLAEKGAKIVFFEPGIIGGAWGAAPLAGQAAPRFNNIIYPYTAAQNEAMPRILDWLRAFSTSVIPVSKDFILNGGQAESIIAGDFVGPITKIVRSPKVSLLPENVKKIEVSPEAVIVNGRFFDFAVVTPNSLPEHLSVESSASRNRIVSISSTTNVSEHVRLKLCREARGPVFSEGTDPVFDRYGFLATDPSIFIGRVSRPWKGKRLASLIQSSRVTSGLQPRITAADIQRFSQRRFHAESNRQLVDRARQSRLIVLDTADFISAYLRGRELAAQF